MSDSEEHKVKFFVYVVESPSAPDLYHGRSEGNIVAQALRLDRIPCVAHTAIDRDAFYGALVYGLSEAMKVFHGHLPVLHFSAHGSVDGLQLSNGDFVTWDEMRTLLVPINNSLSGSLLVCMSACEGFHACQMAMTLDEEPHPFFATVGNLGAPTWSDTAVSYAAFYHLVAKGFSVADAVERMNVACGDGSWVIQTATDAKQSFLTFRQDGDLDGALESLERTAEQSNLPPDVKALASNTSLQGATFDTQ